MNRILSQPSSKAIDVILRHKNEFERLMRSLSHEDETLVQILKVLAHIIKVNSVDKGLKTILQIVLSDFSLEGFLFSLTMFARRMPMIEDGELRKELPNTLQSMICVFDFLLTNYSRRKVVESLPIDACFGAAGQLSHRGSICYQDIGENAQRLVEKRNKLCTEIYDARVSASSQFRSDEWTVALPTSDDLHWQPDVTSNIVVGEFPSLQEYLKIQRNLLREDFTTPFRNAIKGSEEYSDKKFSSVRFCGENKVNSSGETLHKVSFRSAQKSVNWRRNKKLLEEGNLVCFSEDNFATVFYATVAARNARELARGILYVKLESGDDSLVPKSGSSLTMIESPGYFKSYAPVIEKLHEIVPENLPFSQYLVKLQSSIDVPQYLRDRRPIFDLKGIICDCGEDCLHKQINILDGDTWQSLDVTSMLDNSQKRALHLALTSELAVIQGPPGTGKTYIGLKAIHALLKNNHFWRYSSHDESSECPIMVICYKNLALDQFLEGVMKLGVSNNDIVRIGSQCRSPKIKECSLYLKVKEARQRCKHGFLRNHQLNIGIKSQALREFVSGTYVSSNCHQYCPFLSQEVIFDLKDHCSISFPYQSDSRMPLHFVSWLDEDIKQESEALRFGKEERMDDEAIESNKLYTVLGEDGLKVFVEKFGRVHSMKEQEARKYLMDHLHPPKHKDRLSLFKYCLKKLLEAFQAMKEMSKEDQALYRKRKRDIEVSCLREAKVIGLTTTAAASRSDLLSKVRSKILIVEEAAEVLEPQLIASLTQHTQHLILIGDHKQLRPKPTDYRFGKSHKLDISLFERLVTNNMPHVTLTLQHRMRPEIAQIVSDHVYNKKLKDHEKTKRYENVRGVKHNIYFINHDKEESIEDPDIKSHSNEHEASFIACLCKYLLHQGYRPDQISVVTSYKSQEEEIRSKLVSKGINIEKESDHVTINTIDDYQGEENDIILLSLVRSNKRKMIGFINEQNRACVALSRARQGFYCIGNFQLFQERSEFWSSIIDDLKSRGFLGESLELVCHNHKTVTKVSCADDFDQVSDGGCDQPCSGFHKNCGHKCPRKCHPDDKDHESPCKHPCEKVLPNCGHPCTRKCSDPCDEKCFQKVERKLLCGHIQAIDCHVDEVYWLQMCKEPCGVKLLCGHYCSGQCGVCCQGRIHVPCKKVEVCKKVLLCGHQCLKRHPCLGDCPPCTKSCAYECSHNKRCGTCFMHCKSGCVHPCSWKCKHHSCSKLCGELCDRVENCDKPCKKTLKCGHPCLGLCGEPCPPVCNHPKCDTVKKKADIIYSNDELDGSSKLRYIQLKSCKHTFEVQALDKFMKLENDQPIRWKCCPKCSVPVMKTLRYTKTTNQILHDMNMVKKQESKYLSSCQREKITCLLAPLMWQFFNPSIPNISIERQEDKNLHAMYLSTISKMATDQVDRGILKLQRNLEARNEREQTIVSDRSLLMLQSQALSCLGWMNDNIQLEENATLSDQMILDVTAEHTRLLLLLKCCKLQHSMNSRGDFVKGEHRRVLQNIHSLCENCSTKLSCREYQEKIEELISVHKEYYDNETIGANSEEEIICALRVKPDGWYKCEKGHYYNFNDALSSDNIKCPECCSTRTQLDYSFYVDNY